MHDPHTLAFTIPYPWRKYGNAGRSEFERSYREPFISIWHVDPESDGSDNSCGWFMRANHGEKAVLDAIQKDFEFNWDPDYGGWFAKDGKPTMSTIAVVLAMFNSATWEHFKHSRRRRDRFMRRHLLDVIHFAENQTDSMLPAVTGKYGFERRNDRIERQRSFMGVCCAGRGPGTATLVGTSGIGSSRFIHGKNFAAGRFRVAAAVVAASRGVMRPYQIAGTIRGRSCFAARSVSGMATAPAHRTRVAPRPSDRMRFDGIPVRIAPPLIAAAARVDDMDDRAFARLAGEVKPGVRLTSDQRRSLRILGVKRKDVERSQK